MAEVVGNHVQVRGQAFELLYQTAGPGGYGEKHAGPARPGPSGLSIF